jgi:hypothetical protein
MRIYKIKKIDIKRCSRFLTVVYIILLLPMLRIALYASPSADDLPESYAAYTAFQSTGSLFAALAAAAGKSLYYYFNWMGYFTSNFFTCFPFSVFGFRFYGLGTWFILAVLTFAMIFFLRAFLTEIFGLQRTFTNAIAMLLLTVTVQCMPQGAARVEAFFWYCGAAGYTLMFSLCLIYLGLLIRSVTAKRPGSRRCALILACITGFFAGGGSYMSAITTMIVTVLWVLFAFLCPGGCSSGTDAAVFRKRSRMLIIPAVFLTAGFLLSCMAPGNASRAATLSGMNPVKAILVSVYYVLSYAIGEWTGWAVIGIMLLMLPFFWKAAAGVRHVFRYPVAVTVLAFAIPAASITPSMYAVGNIGAGRMQAMFWMHFILCMTLLEGYLTGWAYQHLRGLPREDSEKEDRDQLFSTVSSLFIRFIGFLIIFGSVLCVYTNRDYYTASSAAEDLVNGHAAVYASENAERQKLLTDPSVTDVTLESYTYEPDLLFNADFSTDAADWSNQAAARFYGKQSITRKDQ